MIFDYDKPPTPSKLLGIGSFEERYKRQRLSKSVRVATYRIDQDGHTYLVHLVHDSAKHLTYPAQLSLTLGAVFVAHPHPYTDKTQWVCIDAHHSHHDIFSLVATANKRYRTTHRPYFVDIVETGERVLLATRDFA